MIRDEIPRNSVDLKFMVRPGIGYMHVSAFNETTEQEVEDALQGFGDLKGLILDLRGNPGGLLNEGVGVADKFLKKGQVIVSHHGRSSPEKIYKAAHGNGGKDYPLVVLVNRGTASAAEIVSGAIQDHDRGLIVGEVTFGKGLVQTVYPLSENTGLALTTAKYYTPSGRLIQRDYTGVSLYDYYYSREQEDNPNNNANTNSNTPSKEVKLTDSGRTMFGGGGITPDVKVKPFKTTHFEDTLLVKYAFFNFAKHYLANRHVDKNFEVTDAVMQEFRKFLDSQKIPYTEADLNEGTDYIKSSIKTELFISRVWTGRRPASARGKRSAGDRGAERAAQGQRAGGKRQKDCGPARSGTTIQPINLKFSLKRSPPRWWAFSCALSARITPVMGAVTAVTRSCACQRHILMGESPHIQPYLRSLHCVWAKE